MSNPAPTLNQINAFNATQGTTIDFNIIGGTEVIRSNKIYIYDLSDNSLICTHLYVSTESIHELPPNTSSSIVYASGKSSADFTNNTQYYAQIQTFTDVGGTQGGSGLSIAKLFWCLPTPTLTLSTIPTTISTTSYNVSATYTPNTSGGATNEIQEFQFNLYSAIGALLQTSGVVLYGEGVDLSYNFSGLEVDSTYYVTLDVTTTQGMNVSAQSNTFTVSIDTPTMGSASVVNNGCDGYISVTSNLSSEYEHEESVDSGEIMSFTTESLNDVVKLVVNINPVQDLHGYDKPWVGGAGKNLALLSADSYVSAKSQNNSISYVDGGFDFTAEGNYSRAKYQFSTVVGQEYTLSFDGYSDAGYKRVEIGHTITWGASDYAQINLTETNASYSATFTATDTVLYVGFYITANTATGTATIRNFQLEKGSTATTYEPYSNICPITGWTGCEVDVSGVNLWDEEWEVGEYNNNGVKVNTGYGIRSKNYIPVKPSINLAFINSLTLYICEYDENKAFIQRIYVVSGNPVKQVTSNTHYVTFNTASAYGTTYNHDISINYPSTNTTYQPYQGTTYTSTFPKYKQQVSQDKTPYITKNIGDTYADTLTENLVGGTIAWNQSVPDTTTTHTVSGSVASMDDAVAGNFESVVCNINPVQDLHGYDKPWSGGSGANKWDEVWENGWISSSGDNRDSADIIRSKNYVPVTPNTTYCIVVPSSTDIVYFDENKVAIGNTDKNGIGDTDRTVNTRTTHDNCHYIRFWTRNQTTYNHDIAINYPSSVTTYSPYSNICPISGHTEVDVVRTGKNLLNSENPTVVNAYLGSTMMKANANNRTIVMAVKPNTQYTYVWNRVSTSSSADDSNIMLFDEYPTADVTVGTLTGNNMSSGGVRTFTTTSTTKYIAIKIANITATDFQSTLEASQLELGTTATDYEPYNGTTYTTTLPSTTYGGTLDLVSGVLTVTYAVDVFDGNSITEVNTTSGGVQYARVIASEFAADGANTASICNQYRVDGITYESGKIVWVANTQKVVRICDDRFTNLSTAQTILNSTPAQYCYPLATPTTIQLTPQQIACLLGQNNVWADCGDTSVTYPTNHSYQSLSTTHKYYKRINGVESISVGSDVVADVGTDNIIDLTQMFGTTIADYIYNREQSSSSGMGVKFFKSLFPSNDYDYNSGSLISVNASAHVIKDANGNVVHTYPLDSDLVLRGIPKLDANNKLYYDGDVYEPDGSVSRKYGIVDLGTLSWGSDSSVPNRYRATPSPTMASPSTVAERQTGFICSQYPYSSNTSLTNMTDKGVLRYDGEIFIKDTSYVDKDTFKSAMSGVYLVYELATPTTESADPFEENQAIVSNGIAEYTVTEQGDVEMPVGHDSTYYATEVYGGTIDMASGVLTIDMASVDLGSLNWTYHNSGSSFDPYFYATYSGIKSPGAPYNYPINAICSQYNVVKREVGSFVDGSICGDGDATTITQIQVKDNRYTDATTFKNAMKGVQLVYELATPIEISLTPQQIQTLSGQNNIWSNTNGGMSLIYQLPITSLLVKRRDVADVSGKWLTLYSVPITQASDMDFTFIDFLNQYGKKYQYALVPVLAQDQSGVVVQIEGGYTVSDNVDSIFDGVYIADQTNVERVKAGVGYGNIDMNQGVGSITPIGSKYPIVITNSQNQYHNGSVRGTIVPNDFYSNGNLSRIDMVNKRDELEQFLTNKRAKIIKDWNGKMWLVMIMSNVACSFDDNYGMGMVSFSADWLEVGDPTNQQDLYNAGLINVGGV